MKAIRRGRPWWLGTLLGACLAALPGSIACPRLCACYVPTEVHCTFRYFTAIPPHIPPNVERVNLGYNSLLKLMETDFSGLEKLELLMLHSNEINTIPDKVFSDLYSLQVLKMSYNKVRVLQQDVFYGLKSLVRLHMDHNKIEFVHPNVFYGLTSLRLVHLEGNLLKQLHPDTFVTLRYSQVFKISFMKHIYLSDNVLTSLPQEMFSYTSELESIYLHGNPWSCDCNLQWFAEWAKERPDVTKCKKDRSSGAQQCPVCASPKNHKGKSLVDIPSASLTCTKPAIHDSLKFKNLTVPDDGDFSSVSPKDFIAPIGSMILNMTDQAGSRGNLVCDIQKPKEMSPISFDKDGNSTVLKTSFSAFLVCGIDYEHIQQLWSILALYSNSPLKLERNVLATNMPFYKYKQIYSEKDELFTNIETELRAEPSWLMQSKVALQLDRTATTLNTLHIQYFTDAQIILPSADKKQERNNWTIISRNNKTQTEHTVLVGGTVELECQATGEPAPAIEWILADGSKVRAPYISEDGRIIVVKTGTFTLRTADTFDTGLYHCIGTNYNDADTLTFRITVVDPYVEHNSVNGAQLSTFVGSTLYLPCTSTAVPDAAISWVLPEHVILHHSARNKHIFDNGTLRIQGVTERDSGYFRCVAANQYGVDLLVFQVLVRKDETTLKKKHVAVGEWEEGNGSGNAMLASATRQKHPVATLATLTANRGSAASASRNRVAQSAHKRNSYGKMTSRHYRDKISRRFRGHRRQFVSSARRVDPQRWAAFLEKTKRNSTLIEKRGEVATKPPIQVRKFSKVPRDEEETSGDLISPEEEFMIPVTETATVSALERAMESVITAGPELTTSNTPARKTSLLVAEAVTPLPSPFSQSVSSDSRKPQTYLKPTITNSWERSDLSQISANGIKQSTVSNGASRTSTLFPAGQRLVYSGESNNQHLKSVSMTDVTDTSKSVTSQNAEDKLHVFTESIDKISTKTDHQISVVTVSEPSLEFGYVYFHSTQKPVTPKPPLDSIFITHQQIQIIQDVTTRTPQAQQQYGRRRKISGRRRIVRPGHIPSMKEHRYNFGRPGSVRGSTAVSADVQLNMKYVSNLPTLNNLSSSINPFSPEAPLSSPSTTNMPLEHPAGTRQNTAFLREEENKASARQKATTTVMPLFTKGTQDTPQWKLETSAPLQTNTDRGQPFSIRRPTTAIHTAHITTEITHTISTKISSTLESVSPSIKPRTSAKNSQRGEITWERLFGNGAQKEVLLQKLPKQQTDMFLSTEVSTMLPRTTAALSMSKMSPLHFTPVSTGGNHSSGFLSLNKPIHYGNGNSEEHLPTAKLQSYSNPATSATKEMHVTSLKPTVIPIITPQTDNKITKSKTFRVGRKRGQRRKRPPKISTSQSMTAGQSTAAIPSVNTATAVVTTVKSLTMPTSLTSAKPLCESVSAVLATEMPALWILNTPDASLHMPAAATQTSATPVTRRNIQSATLPPKSRIAQSPTTPIQTTPLLSKPFSATSARPATVSATSGSEPAQQIKATTTASEKSHPKMEERVIQENHVAQPTFPARTESSTRAPAASRDISPPSPQHPTPLPALTAVVPPARTARTTSPPWGEIKFRQKSSAKVTERGNTLTVNTLTILKPSQVTTLYAPLGGRDKDSSVKGWSEKRQDRETTTNSLIAMDFLSRNHFAKPRIIGGKLAAFTVLANSDAFIPCEATGNPHPTIQWTKISSGTDALESRGDGRWMVFANGTLSITRAGLEDRGQYLCTAANPHGTARLLVTLSVVAYPPRIIGGRWQLLTAHSGKPVAVKCRAEGRPPPTVLWVLANKTHVSNSSAGNNKVHMEPDGTLIIKEVTVYDRGLYTCMAKNPAGTDTLVVKLQVIAAPPTILEEKRQRVEGMMGENLKLPCTVKGNPQPTVHWVLFDGTVVKPLQFVNAKLFLFSNGTLHLSNIVPSDSGNYECIATSSTGSERRVVSLVVEHRDTLPKIATASQEMTQLNFGDKLLLNCTATGEPKPRIIWRLPSKAVVDQWHRMGSRIHVYPNGSLVIQAVTEKDAGDYLCVARNKIGDDLILMKVSITMKPAKIDQKQYFKKLVPYGKDFKVDCKASGSPAPEISWSLPDGTVINNAMLADDSGRRSRRYVLFDNGTLYLNKVGVTEGGDYTCYAQNTLGRDEMKIRITVVMAAPQIKHNYKTYVKVKAGDMALLDCEAAGEPKPKIFWLLPSSDMISSSTARHFLHVNGSLSVGQVKLLDAGEYMCVARNPGGDDTKLYKLDVVAKPPIINGLYVNKTIMKVTAVRHSKKQIDCRAEGTPPPQIMWIMPDNIFLTAPYYGSRIVVHKNGTLEIRNIRPSDTADFICVARNDGGESMLVVQLEVLEMLRRPMFKNPFNEKIIARPGKTTTLNCSVDGNPPPDISWMLPNGTWFSNGIKTSQFLTGSNGTLTIYNPDRDKAGKYRCAARNKVGYIEKLIVLEVGQKPTILTHPTGPVKGISGESLSLHCLSDGSPKPNTAWTLPGGYVLDRPQINRKYVLLENGTLVIREAAIHDRGNYVCKAHNNAGDSSITVPVVIVAYPPRITNRPPQTIHTMPGAAVQLHCIALGIPKPEITWELPDHSVLSTGNQGRASGSELLHPHGTLLIQNPRPSDSGAYKCTAKNHLGSDFTVTYIHVI
ncbi:PREDICTED: immunoglobulin superfamily member 10 [Aptenodytes forsteri]|uniref:immunoglobulin superfamily member 10 n=1 Tax=Aptenodytes forsteri TaxID=9233 RepID=UPI00090598C3|nr:PREDICTED: immunoglobulin superfamily member 10 [Aptenodytes forsteri]